MNIRWGLSTWDWHDHATTDDECQDHPTGLLKAKCGHVVKALTPLRDTSCGTPCETCTIAATPPGHPVNWPEWAASTLDHQTHLLDPTGNPAPGVLKAQCGHYLLAVAPLPDDPALPRRCPQCHQIFTIEHQGVAQ